jgi:predicted amidophosphoribosyltransferase
VWRAAGGGLVTPRSLGLDGIVVMLAYDALVGRVVLAAKNGGRRDLLAVLGRNLAYETQARLPGPGRFDVITWVPASRRQARRRGYDQGRLLAVATGRSLGVPARCLLARSRHEAQAGRSRTDRLQGPELRPRRPCPARVLLVDDVATTGASLARAAAVLRGAGARTVHGAVVAARA